MTDSNNEAPKPPEDLKNIDPAPTTQPDPQQSGVSPSLQPNLRDMRDLKTAQSLALIASIAGPVSLFIGGILLGSAGLVCGIIGFRKLNRLIAKQNDVAKAAARIKRSSIIGMCVCGVAIVLNAVSMYFMYPVILEMLETGDFSGLSAGTGTGAAESNSVWG